MSKQFYNGGRAIDHELFAAVVMREFNNVQDLINKGADVNFKHPEGGTTPLHIAVRSCSVDIVKLLIEKGAHTNILDNSGHAPVYYSGTSKHLDRTVRIVDNYTSNYSNAFHEGIFYNPLNLDKEVPPSQSYGIPRSQSYGIPRSKASSDLLKTWQDYIYIEDSKEDINEQDAIEGLIGLAKI